MALLLPASPHITVVDASTDDGSDGDGARRFQRAGPSVIAVGSGGFAGALAAIWSVRAPAGGRARQRSMIIPKRMNTRILLQVSSLNPVSRAQVARLRRRFPTSRRAAPPSAIERSVAVAESLAREFWVQVEREEWDILVGLIGGDGARETLAQLGASGIRIVDSLVEGIPLGVVVGGRGRRNTGIYESRRFRSRGCAGPKLWKG